MMHDEYFQHYAANAKWVTDSSLFYLTLAYSTLIISKFNIFLSDPCAHGVRSLGSNVCLYERFLKPCENCQCLKPSEDCQCCQCCEDLANED